MNRIKTFFYFTGTIMLVRILTALITFSSNKLFDDLPDVIYIVTLGFVMGYIPYMLASMIALETTKNENGTRKILWIWKLIISSLYFLYGTVQIIFQVYLNMPLFDVYEEVTIISQHNQWFYNIPFGVIGIVACIQLKKTTQEIQESDVSPEVQAEVAAMEADERIDLSVLDAIAPKEEVVAEEVTPETRTESVDET